jgi:EmrB/QacA subfamily drug resistance transporter
VTAAASPAATASRPAPARNRWLGLVALTIGVAMIIVDATIVNVAIPSIIRDLGIGITQAEWANAIYSLVFAALLISVGRVGDVTGRRRVFVLGLIVFLGASLVTALAPSGSILLFGRFLQGVGGALILPSTLSIVNATFRGRERAIAFGIWGSVIGGTAALGPLLGGWFVTNLSWRWAFYINLPLALLALAGAFLFVGESRDPDARPGFDLAGSVLSTIGFLGIVFGLIEGQTYGWWTAKQAFLGLSPGGVSAIPFAFAVGVAGLAAFLVVERARARSGRTVLVDFALFRIPSFRYGNVAVLIVGLGELGLVFVIPLFLQTVLGLSAFDTGLILAALAAGAFVAGGFAAPLTRRIGPQRVVQLGLAIEVVGIVAVGLTFSADRPGWQFCPQLFVYGVGVGFATAQLTSVILADVPPAQSGEGSGIQSTSRQVGSALGIAILGTALTTGLASGTADRLASAESIPPATRSAIVAAVERSGGAVLPELRRSPALRPAVAPVEAAFVDSARRAAFIAAAFVLVGLLASLRLPRTRARLQEVEGTS